MKGDFSRLPPAGAPYSGVWLQQGRVQLDQDWNEQLVLQAERSRAALRDLVGGDGAPAGEPGFRVRARGGVHCGGVTVLEAELEVGVSGGELTVEVRIILREGEDGGVVVEVEGWFSLWIDEQGRPAFRVGGDAAPIVSPEPLSRGVPVLVSAAYDGGTAVLHLDGRPVAAAAVAPPPPSAAPLRVGGSRGADGEVERGFGGTLDELRLWRQARPPALLRASAARTLTGGEEGLYAWFPLDEGEGRTAHDLAGGRDAFAPVELLWNPHELTLGSGRMYVDGVPCVSPAEVPLDGQPDLPGATPLGLGRHLVYLDVWERYLSAAEDPALREVALGGLDTTGRTRTVWQARSLPLGPDQDARDALLGLRQGRLRSTMAARRQASAGPAPGNRLYRVEVHSSGGLYGWPRPPAESAGAAWVVGVESAPGGGGTLTLAPDGPAPALVPGARVEIFTPATDQQNVPGALAHVTAVDPAWHRVTVDALPPGLAVGDEARVRPVATFLWSDDNAWQAWPVYALDGATGLAQLGDVGPEGLPLVPGDLVELSDEATVLLPRPGLLLTVRDVDPYAGTVTLDAPVACPAGGEWTLLRRWSRAPRAPADAVPAQAGWTPLGDGVEVCFQEGVFRTGDYWTVPMRVAAPGGLEWPTGPAALPPQGIQHGYAALATVVVHPHPLHPDGHRMEVHDHRRIFQPLVTLTQEVESPHPQPLPPNWPPIWPPDWGDDSVVIMIRDERGVRVDVDVDSPSGGERVQVDVDEARDGGERVQVDVDETCDGGETVQLQVDDDPGSAPRVVLARLDPDGGEKTRVIGEGEDVSITTGGDGGHPGPQASGEGEAAIEAAEEDAAEAEAAAQAEQTAEAEQALEAEEAALQAEEAAEEKALAPGGDGLSVGSGLSGGAEALVAEREDVDRSDAARVGVPAQRPGEDVHGAAGDPAGAGDEVSRAVDLRGGEDALDAGSVGEAEGAGGGSMEVGAHARGAEGGDGDVRVVHAAPAVPPGFWIFGETHEAPDGWAATGARFTLPHAAPAWRPRASLPGAASGPVRCVVLDGTLFALRDATGEVLRYDPLADEWRVEARLPEPWRAYAAAALDGRIHLVGGRDARGRMVDRHLAWDPATGRWETRAPLGSPRAEMGAAALGGLLYVAGGVRTLLSLTTAAVDAYDPRADAWTGCRRMAHARSAPSVAAAAGRLFVVGGRQPGMGVGRPSPHAEWYDPVRERWKDLDDVPVPRKDTALAGLDGVLHLVGGDAGAGPTSLTHEYPLRGGGWVPGPEMDTARAGHGLAAFSGRLCAVGGGAGQDAAGSVEECRLFFDLHGFRKE